MRTERATSAGGVVVDERGNLLMIARRSPAGKIQWTLPKGLVEPGESPEETAVREVGEETGVSAEITGPPKTIDYWFVWKPDDARYHKFVHYFPMRTTAEPRREPDGEAESVEWVAPADALTRASFANERAVLADVLGIEPGTGQRAKNRKRTDATSSNTPKPRERA